MWIFTCLALLLCLTDAAMQPMAVLQYIRQQARARQDLITNALVGGVLFSASDVLAQRLEQFQPLSVGNAKEEKKRRALMHHFLATERSFFRAVDWKRCASAGALGVCLSCGLYPAGYGAIDKLWNAKNLISSAQKSVVEVFTVGLLANTLSMLVRGLAPGGSGSSPKQVMIHIMEELPKVTRDDFVFWFPYNMAAFTFVPTRIRPMSTMLMDSIWQTYMSLKSNNFSDDKAVYGVKLV